MCVALVAVAGRRYIPCVLIYTYFTYLLTYFTDSYLLTTTYLVEHDRRAAGDVQRVLDAEHGYLEHLLRV